MSQLAAGKIEIKTPDGMLPASGKFSYQLSGSERTPVVNHDGVVDFIEKAVEGFIEGEVLLKSGVDPDKFRNITDSEITLSLGTGANGPVATLTLFDAFHGPPIEGDTDGGTLKVKFFGRTELLVK